MWFFVVVKIVVVVFSMKRRHVQLRLLISQPHVDVVSTWGTAISQEYFEKSDYAQECAI